MKGRPKWRFEVFRAVHLNTKLNFLVPLVLPPLPPIARRAAIERCCCRAAWSRLAPTTQRPIDRMAFVAPFYIQQLSLSVYVLGGKGVCVSISRPCAHRNAMAPPVGKTHSRCSSADRVGRRKLVCNANSAVRGYVKPP